MKNYVIKWTNRLSREEGYVQEIDNKNGYFINTPVKSDARVFFNKGLAASAIKRLTEMGEAKDNELEAVEV